MTVTDLQIAVNADRVLRHLTKLSQIGADPDGGVTRLAYTQADLVARTWFINQAQEIGLTVSIDPMGNILAVEPEAEQKPPVLSGSHLDTVRQGGRLDGALGVVAALEAVRAIRACDDHPQRRPLGVLVLAAEESTRFGSACLGSRAIVSDLPEASLTTLVDDDGVTLFEALQQAGLEPDRFGDTRRAPGWFHEFVELHIDQADDLERAGAPLGVITAIAAPTRLWITMHGEQAHSGATVMSARRDALTAAAEVVLAVEATARAHAQEHIVGTVGVLRVHPGSMNTVPGMVELGVDIRGVKTAIIDQVVRQVSQAARKIAGTRRLTVDIELVSRAKPVPVSLEQQTNLEAACRAVGAKSIRMVSRSAHDAMYLARHGPISMLFVRNPAGISHNPAETARDDDVILATSALATYLAQIARRG